MRILITGGKGMLGRTLVRHWQKNHEVFVADLPEVDLTDVRQVEETWSRLRPQCVVHCAAMTRVDDCESTPERAFLLNKTVTAHVAHACQTFGARLIAISTDYVFSGDLPGERSETDLTAPKTVYGASKLAGETAALKLCENTLIARIAWLYGAGGPSFVHTMLQLARANPTRTLSVVNDQFGNPTSTDAVADLLTALLDRPDLRGIFHVTCEGTTSWYEFAKTIFRLAGYSELTVTPCSTEAFPRPAPRPHYSALSKQKLKQVGLPPMPPWQQALKQFIASEWPLINKQ